MKYKFTYKTPIGNITIAENGTAITNLMFGDEGSISDGLVKETSLLRSAATQIEEYFACERQAFDLPLAPKGTSFQVKVWEALQDIPYGETRSYKDIAVAVGSDKACRAVGMANNKNPISIIIPCHRVIGSNGKLVGYGGGLDIKKYLLDLESSFLFH